MDENSIARMPWAEFMEDALKGMVESRAEKVMMVCKQADGLYAVAFTENVTINDLALASFWLNQTALSEAAKNEENEDE